MRKEQIKLTVKERAELEKFCATGYAMPGLSTARKLFPPSTRQEAEHRTGMKP